MKSSKMDLKYQKDMYKKRLVERRYNMEQVVDSDEMILTGFSYLAYLFARGHKKRVNRDD